MKKTVSAVLVVCLLLCCLHMPAAAQAEEQVIRLRINSDVAGCTEDDCARIAEILSPQVVYRFTRSGRGPVLIAAAAGGSPNGPIEAGRMYTLTCMFAAADGYALPDTLSEGDVVLECGKGITVISCEVVNMSLGLNDDGTAKTEKALRVYVKLIADGSVFRRMIGIIKDLIQRIRAWSLY